MDKEFIQILAAALGVTDQESLQAKVQELGEEGLKTMYSYYQQIKESGADANKSVELMKQAYNKITGVTMNKLGSKLNYIKKLRGECPEGYEAVKFAQGGRIKTECKKCGGNIEKAEGGTKTAKRRFTATKYNTDNGYEVQLDSAGYKSWVNIENGKAIGKTPTEQRKGQKGSFKTEKDLIKYLQKKNVKLKY